MYEIYRLSISQLARQYRTISASNRSDRRLTLALTGKATDKADWHTADTGVTRFDWQAAKKPDWHRLHLTGKQIFLYYTSSNQAGLGKQLIRARLAPKVTTY